VQEALHPTPAVCGHPKPESYAFLQRNEHFDRGFYSGPFGFVSARGAEFVVGIRSALITPPRLAAPFSYNGTNGGANCANGASAAPQCLQRTAYLYAGVGVVEGSDAESEWCELDLKVAQFRRILPGLPRLRDLPNDNAVWVQLIVDELVRCGVSTFGVAPGSRSSPLTHAVFLHPRAEHMVCVDERSLGFWALGHAVATGAQSFVPR
jgi:isochorismate synthase / 2-succinyl-5-enolpyruvyl-6-hydroxy-3-cyclohexene-1-carboxylate synthase / 2-succinyl-6-hydroxy-2,4-cyclohexadiene-1-carboxylate synthase / o-succinylbenzoate synthase